MRKRILFCLLSFSLLVATGQRLPNRIFGIFPLFGELTNTSSFTDAQINGFMDELKSEVGENKGLFRVGFGGIMGPEARLQQVVKLSKQNNLSHVVVLGTQTHAVPANIKTIATNDLRNFQWRKDGATYNGVAGGEGRDVDVVTPSRYATTLRNEFKATVVAKAKGIKRVMDLYPNVILGVNVCIEQGLADNTVDGRMGDYSPFAVTEFRDWLRHTAIYDASTGAYPTEGAPTAIVGNLISINGKMRSQFYDDPSPSNANGTGVSFNTKFGTAFTTWTLKYWDLTAFPAAITATGFDLTPTSGQGFTSDGFEAPRTFNAGNSFWKAWSWDLLDQSNNYPTGNPTNPAFGFRQQMNHNFINDVMVWVKNEGIPSSIITAHQVPGEMLTNAQRAKSIASPIWTGLSKLNGSVGITRYGSLNNTDIGKITQYTDSWGIYEWHPDPSPTDNADLKARTKTALDNFYKNNCQFVCPFSWRTGSGGLIPGGTSFAALYPVKNCGFAFGLKEWLNQQSGYTGVPTATEYFTSTLEVSIFPNPSKSGVFKLNIATDWVVYTLLGNQISNGYGTEINLSNHPKGNYFVSFNGRMQKVVTE
jgi:hypothetical protein